MAPSITPFGPSLLAGPAPRYLSPRAPSFTFIIAPSLPALRRQPQPQRGGNPLPPVRSVASQFLLLMLPPASQLDSGIAVRISQFSQPSLPPPSPHAELRTEFLLESSHSIRHHEPCRPHRRQAHINSSGLPYTGAGKAHVRGGGTTGFV
jgi:hypothetical protein